MFQTSLNQYFFDSELSNFPAPLFALMVPLIVFRKKRVWNLMLMEVMYSIMFLNCALGLIFYNRYISDLDLFTAINLGILVYLIPFSPNIKKIVTVLLCLLIIVPIATTALKSLNDMEKRYWKLLTGNYFFLFLLVATIDENVEVHKSLVQILQTQLSFL